MFELHHSAVSSIGNLSEVWIDKKSKLCKKYYKPGGTTANGKSNVYDSIEAVTKMFNNEIYWSTKLKSEWVIETYEYGPLVSEPGFYLLQEYLGPDLLTYHLSGTLHSLFPDILEQVESMFAWFQSNDVYKKNNALSNMTGINGRIKAFDFKYAESRSIQIKQYEINSIDQWLSKIDPTTKDRLRKYV